MDVEKVRNNYRICDYHFAPEYMVGVQHFSISGLVTGAIPTLNSSSYVELDNNALIVQDETVNLTMESISSPRPQFNFEVVAGPSHEHKHPDLLDRLTPNVGTRRAFAAICFYYDKYRHKDPYFNRKLKLKRKRTRFLNKVDEDKPIKFDITEDKEARIFKEIKLAESSMNFQDYSKAVIHFSNAIAGCVDPCNLLQALNKSLPDKVFDELVDRLQRIYQEKMKAFKENDEIRRRRKSLIPHLNLIPADKYLHNAGFPPGITVDDLYLYRRKKSSDAARDTLKLENGSYQTIKSEYKRRYNRDIFQKHALRTIKRPEDTFKIEGGFYFHPENYDSFVERPFNINHKALLAKQMEDPHKEDFENSDDEHTNKNTKNRRLFRRPTVLKVEGDFYKTTENAANFVKYLLSGRNELLRHPTTLKLEGVMETKTENRDKFIPFEYQCKPPLLKSCTNLHMEGVLDGTTENRENFLPIKPQPRRPLTKRTTNLHLEGDMTMDPEYRHVFIPYKNLEKTQPTFPLNNLKIDGFLETETEKMEKFVRHNIQPIIPSLRDIDSRKFTLGNYPVVKKAEYKSKFVEHPKMERSFNLRPKENLKLEGDMSVSTENKTHFIEKPASKSPIKKINNNLLLEGKIDLNPEYKNAYVNFYKDAYGNFEIVKHQAAPKTRRAHFKSEDAMETNPEYRSSFVDFPRQRPSTRKPREHIHIEGNVSNMTEKRAQFVKHPIDSKPRLVKRQTELKLEGPIECYPEYRRAYIDYVTRDNAAERQPRYSKNFDFQKQRILNDGLQIPTNIDESTNPKSEASTRTVRLVVDDKSHYRHSSLSPTLSSSTRRSNTNLASAENRLFGPKLPIYFKKNLKAETERRLSDSNSWERMSRARRRYGAPEFVENLAFVSPVRYHTPSVLQSRCKNDSRKNEKHSFVVLGNFELEPYTEFNKPSSSKHLFKEQKWMSSWNSTLSK
ncbi:hypothetical protein FQR65_LT05682 [Abscondita terminalis]|nr:hypothetical protein FQR65_LT05682 [Abscondita terminalis]